MTRAANDNEQMVERVERALLILAYLVEKEGDIHLPMYEQFEVRLSELRSQNDARSRAKSRLQSFMAQGHQAVTSPSPRIEAA